MVAVVNINNRCGSRNGNSDTVYRSSNSNSNNGNSEICVVHSVN